MKNRNMFARLAVTAALLTGAANFIPQANAALSTADKAKLTATTGSKSALIAAAKLLVANATTPAAKEQAAKDIAAFVAVTYPSMAAAIVGNLAAGNQAAAPGIAAAAAQANNSVAVAVARSAAAAAPAYAAQITSQVSNVAQGAASEIASAVVAASTAGSDVQAALVQGNNPADVSTGGR